MPSNLTDNLRRPPGDGGTRPRGVAPVASMTAAMTDHCPTDILKEARSPAARGLGLLLGLLLLLPGVGQAGQWRNPKEVIGAPALARLQQGRKELSPGEKEDIQKYGYTGLEVMTYLDRIGISFFLTGFTGWAG